MSGQHAKENIIETVISMLKDGAEAEELTVREIAKNAGVGVGLINYHFQTKENLIDIAVQRYADNIIDMVPGVLDKLEGTAKQKLKSFAKLMLNYFANNPSAARITILRDLSSAHAADNTERVFNVLEPLILQITGDDRYWMRLLTSIFCFTFQSAFLRAGVIKETTGFDFFDDEQRSQYVEDTIETVLQNII